MLIKVAAISKPCPPLRPCRSDLLPTLPEYAATLSSNAFCLLAALSASCCLRILNLCCLTLSSSTGGGGGGAYPGHGYYFWNNNPANPQYYDSYFRFPYGGRGRDQFNQPQNAYNSSASGGGVGHAYSNVNSPYDNPDRGSGIVQVAASGTANTGGGGGGGAHGNAAQNRQGGNGGSGIVMVRYQYQG